MRCSAPFRVCPICLDDFDAPVLTPCGHRFCEACIKAALQQKKECPSCRSMISSHRSLRADSQLAPLFQANSTMLEAEPGGPTPGDSWTCTMCTLANPMASERCLACACRRPAKLTWRPTAMGREAAIGPRGSGDSGLMESSAYSAPESDSESEVNEYEESEGEGEESDDEESEGEESDDEESEDEKSDEDWAEVEDDTSPTAAPPPVGLGHDQATAPCPACDGMIILTLTRSVPALLFLPAAFTLSSAAITHNGPLLKSCARSFSGALAQTGAPAHDRGPTRGRACGAHGAAATRPRGGLDAWGPGNRRRCPRGSRRGCWD
jgi:hypothetical protein